MCIIFKILTCVAKIKICCKKYSKKKTTDNNEGLVVFKHKRQDTVYYILKDNIEDSLTKYNFLAIEYTDDLGKIEIKINNKKHHFMICDNTILDYHFLKWYLKKFNNYKIKDNYEIDIIDQNANVIKINQNNSITLNKDSYIINE